MLGENIFLLISKLFLHISLTHSLSLSLPLFLFRVRVAANNTGNGEGALSPYNSVDATTSEYFNIML